MKDEKASKAVVIKRRVTSGAETGRSERQEFLEVKGTAYALACDVRVSDAAQHPLST